MKTKILFQLFLFASLGLIYFTMTSESGGYYNNGTSCNGGGCHGALNSATTVMLDGLPANYALGQTYNLTVTIINSNTTQVQAGFNVKASAGSFVAGSGSQINGAAAPQITHTSPKAMSGHQAVFTFNWIAPTSASAGVVTFNAAGNAVNNASGSNGDEWNTISATVNPPFATTIQEANVSYVKCYPNPATDKVIIEGIGANAKNIRIISLFGQNVQANYSLQAETCEFACNHLAAGTYFVSADVNGKTIKTSFVKQ